MPADLSVGQFVYVIRKRIQLPSEKAIFIFVRNTLPPIGAHYYHYSDAWEDNAYLHRLAKQATIYFVGHAPCYLLSTHLRPQDCVVWRSHARFSNKC